ncbi:hypothetical protein HAX54_003421, partial [Datura stramonium]|nr:hypothetical protein [Datura stramonium]
EPSALARKSKGKLVVEESSKGKRIEKCECMAKKSDVGVQSTILGLIEVQRRGTEEIDRLTMLLAQGETNLALLKAEQTTSGTSWEPGVMLALQNKNALLREENYALKKHVEDLAQQLLCDTNAANARRSWLLLALDVWPSFLFVLIQQELEEDEEEYKAICSFLSPETT